MAGSKECTKCGGRMTEGFVLDLAHGTYKPAGWVTGEPTRSIWTGIKMAGRKPVTIVSWRCDRCGFLENYAPQA